MTGFSEHEYYCFSDNPILKGFDAICETWFCVIKDYSEIFKSNDAIYWYNERASLSSFCSALGRLGITFMEEYSALKGQGEGEKPARSRGRVDLCFFHNQSLYIAEAKYLNRYFTQHGLKPDFSPALVLTKACRDAERSHRGQSDRHALGLTFVTLGFASNLYDTIDNQLSKFIHGLPKLSGCDFLAYCALNSLRNLKSNSCWYFPMTLLVGKIVREAETLNSATG